MLAAASNRVSGCPNRIGDAINKKKEANWHFFLLGFVWGFFQGKKKKKDCGGCTERHHKTPRLLHNILTAKLSCCSRGELCGGRQNPRKKGCDQK